MKKLKPNVQRGGKATNIGGNLYYMSGRKHSAGGIDIGDTLEVEGGEVVQTTPKEVKVFSAQPILNGKSPAKLVMGGANPANVFNAQERFKDMNGLNDDGTTKFACGGRKKKTNGGLVSVNGNVVNRVIGDISFPSSTGGRKRAALGTRERDKDYVVMNGKLYRQTNDEFGEVAYEPVDDNTPNSRLADGRGSAARKSDREVRAAARRDAKTQTANTRWTRGNNFNEVEPFTPTPSKSSGNSKPNTNNRNKGTGFTVIENDKRVHYPSVNAYAKSKNKPIDSDVQAAAKRDAKGGRTDFRNMLEIPEFTPDSYSRQSTNNVPTAQTRVTPKETPVKETVQPTATKTSVPQTTNAAPRRRSTNRTSTASTAAKPTAAQQRTAPNFASLDSMMQGLPTASKTNTPNRLESPVAANQNVPDVISSPKKRLALFDQLDTSDIIGFGSNIAGTIASSITTNRALNRMEAPTKQQVYEPVMEQANKLKTTFNINPQLGEITEQTRRAMGDIGANTSSSRASLRGKQRARNASQYAKNNLYGQKENIETQLINQDRMNRQQVASRNTAAHNDYINRKSLAEYDYANKTAQFNNSIREQKASSLNRTFSGINTGIQDMLSRIENRRNYNNTLGIYDATHPNVDRRLFTSKGVKF